MNIAEGAGRERARETGAKITLLRSLCGGRRAASWLGVGREEVAADGARLAHRPRADGVSWLVVYANHAVSGAPVKGRRAGGRAAGVDPRPDRAILRVIRPAGEQAAVGVAQVVIEGENAATERCRVLW